MGTSLAGRILLFTWGYANIAGLKVNFYKDDAHAIYLLSALFPRDVMFNARWLHWRRNGCLIQGPYYEANTIYQTSTQTM
jgi:hypothetical protein